MAGVTYEFDGAKTIFLIDGQRFTAGHAGTRFFRDLLRDFGEDKANEVVKKGPSKLREGRSRWPVGPRPKGPLPRGPEPEEQKLRVEELLLAFGLEPSVVEELRREYRKGREATVDLGRYRDGC
ncbi:MAG: hypothetical protein ACE5JD_01755 [Candidatus Methylomirabilia bacterium]